MADKNLSDIEIVSLSYDEKVKLLEMLAQDTLNDQVEFSELTGRYFELKTRIQLRKQIASMLQSAIKAERAM